MSIRKKTHSRRADKLALKKTKTLKAHKLLTVALIIIAISLLPLIAIPTALAAPGGGASDPIIYDPGNTDDFPLYPAPGGVSLGKSARWIDGSDYMKAEIDLIVSGQPRPQGVDVVLILDVSGSMGDPITNGSYYYIPNPNAVSRQVTLTKGVTYGVGALAGGMSPPDVSIDGDWTTQTNQTVEVTFTVYVDTTTNQIVAASDFTGSIPGLDNSADDYYLRYPNATSGTGYNPGAGADRYTSAGAKDFYRDVFAGDVITVDGINVTLPSNFSSLPDNAVLETTRIEQMQIAANEFLDIMYEENSYVDAYGVTQTTASPHRVSMLTFSYTDVLYENGAFFGQADKSAMQSWIASREPGGTTNYVDALNAAQKIVESRNTEDGGLYADRPIFVVFMSDGVPQIPANANNGAKYIGSGREVDYANPGTGDAYAINNARANLHTALNNANSVRNGVYTIGYMMSSDEGKSWLNSIAKASGTYNAVNNVEAITDVFRRIAGEAKEAGTNAVITDYMGSPDNPENTYFDVDVTYPVKIKIGNSASVVLTMTQSGADEYTYTSPSLPGQSVKVDKSVIPNAVIWELGSILQDEAVLTFGVELPETNTELNGLYYTNEAASIVYENYLGNFVSRPLPKSPQLLKPGNSIRIVYFATNENGYAVAANGNQLGTAGQTVEQVNTVGNIFGTNAIIINDYYFEYDGRITLNPLPVPYHIIVDSPLYSKDGMTYEKVDVPGAFRTYDADADTYSNNNGDNCDVTMLETTSNGFIVLVGYNPKFTVTVTDQYGSATPITRYSENRVINSSIEEIKAEIHGYIYSGVTITATGIVNQPVDNDIAENPAGSGDVFGSMPYGNVVIAYKYSPRDTEYSVEYYIDGEDTPFAIDAQISGKYDQVVTYSDIENLIDDNCPSGYKYDRMNPPGGIKLTMDPADNVIKAYYVVDDDQWVKVTFISDDTSKGALTGTTVFNGIKGAGTPAITEPGTAPEPGYEFDSWDKTIPAVYPNENMTITGSWKTLTYTITYVYLFDAPNSNPSTFTVDDIPFDIVSPGKRDGYVFGGWFSGADFVTKVTEITEIGDKTLYAMWLDDGSGSFKKEVPEDIESYNVGDAIEYTISFNLPDELAGIEIISIVDEYPSVLDYVGYSLTINDEPVTPYVTATSSSLVDVALTAEQLTEKAGMKVKLTLQFIINSTDEAIVNDAMLFYDDTEIGRSNLTLYKVKYDANGGSGAPEDSSVYSVGSAVSVKSGIPIRDGFTFAGWYYAETTLWAGDTFNMPDANVTLLAQWEMAEYTITYNNLEGATNSNPAKFTEYNLPITLVSPGTRALYAFTGWYWDAELTEQVTVIDTVGDKVVYAGWRGTGGSNYIPPPPVVIEDEGPPLADLDIVNHFAYIVGYGDGTVRSQYDITRAELSTIFFRLLTYDSRVDLWSKTNSFTDVDADSWYNNAVSTLANGGILLGYADGTFRPDATITRAELAAIAVRFQYNGDISSFPPGLQTFSDIEGHWAENYIKLACELGYVNGYSDGTFRPDAPISRAEVMMLLNNVLNRHVDSYEDMLDGMHTWSDNPRGEWFYFAIQEATNSHYFSRKIDKVEEIEAENGDITENVVYSIYEEWTELRESPDWSALEHPTATPYDVTY